MSATPHASAPGSGAFAVHGGILWILAGGCIIGFAPVLVRISEMGPLATAGWRMMFSALAIAPFWALSGAAGRASSAYALWPALLAGLFFAIDIGFFHTSLTLTSIAHATLIVNLAPVVALGAGVLLFAERLGAAKLAGLVLSLGGAIAMTAGRSGVSGTVEGNVLAFIGMFGYAAYLIAIKRARRDASVLSVMFWSSAVSAALLFFAAALNEPVFWPQNMQSWAVMAGLGIGIHAFGQGIITIGMRETPVGLASILLLTQPLIAAIAAWFLFDETLGALELAGAAAVALGIGLAMQARR